MSPRADQQLEPGDDPLAYFFSVADAVFNEWGIYERQQATIGRLHEAYRLARAELVKRGRA